MRTASNGEPGVVFRQECERLWEKFNLYADEHFVSEFPLNTQERYWEMYLGSTLLEIGYSLEKTPVEAPDLCIKYNGRRLWIECICPKKGDGEDRVPQARIREACDVPRDQILLRLSHGLKIKNEQLLSYREAGIVGPDDLTLIAISGAQLGVWADLQPSCAVRCTYGIGDTTVTFDPEPTHGSSGSSVGNSYRLRLTKKSGADVSQTPFLGDSFSEVSGAIFDMMGLGNYRSRMGSTLVTVPNLCARNCLPEALVPRGREYRLVDDKLIRFDHEVKA